MNYESQVLENIFSHCREYYLALATHPLICECGEPKHANEVICEDCRIAYRIENSSVL